MRPMANARLTCISNFPVTTYSGMLPGVLAGQYPRERMEIDLVRLCAAAGARLIVGDVTGMDPQTRELVFEGRPPLPFDVLSIGIGSVPKAEGIAIDREPVVPIKPMQTFTDRLAERLQSWRERAASETLRLVVVGGGAGGVEIAFCVTRLVRRVLPDTALSLTLIHGRESLVPGSRAKTSLLATRELERRGVELHVGRTVTSIAMDHVILDDTTRIGADVVLWATGAGAPGLLSRLNLPTDEEGFLLTRRTLQTAADLPVFVVGDSGTRTDAPTPKAGVYAVRQGPILWQNIRRLLEGRPLRRFDPQADFLKILNTGDGRAIAEYKGFSNHGRGAWKLKDWIDGRFMDKYQDYTPMPMSDREDTSQGRDGGEAAMKCAGCGCKVSARVLSNALGRLDLPPSDRVEVGLATPDDAAVLRAATGKSIVVTTDFFTAPFDDAYLVGRIAALNAASDAFAMGARPVAALAMATLPDGGQRQQEQLLYELLAGAVAELRPMGATLVGGHTIEGPQLTVGFTVLAEPLHSTVCTKAGLQPGDALILTKPLGAGVLLAAHMRARCPAAAMEALLETMLQSNEPAARLAVEMGVCSMTDVTGFGLAGHLLEMLAASNVAAEVELSAVPLLAGAAELLAEGLESTIAPANRSAEGELLAGDAFRGTPRYAALFDPQTSGGLLLGIRADQAAGYLQRVAQEQDRSNGSTAPAAVIGQVVRRDENRKRIHLI